MFLLQIPLLGRPSPTAIWQMGQDELKLTSRINYEIVDGVAKLLIKDCSLKGLDFNTTSKLDFKSFF